MPGFGKFLALTFFLITSSLLTLSTSTLLSVKRPVFAQQAFTTPPVYEITPGIPVQPTAKGSVFFIREFDLDYKGGKVMLSSKPDGTGDTLVDDAIQIRITKSTGEQSVFNHQYPFQCKYLVPTGPKDLSNLLTLGVNHIRAALYDICGTYKSSTPLYLVTEKEEVPPEPFLDLPLDYSGNNMSFNEAATSINAYFDHEYPLLSAGLTEPHNVISYRGGASSAELDYSSHDGYDYGTPAKVNLGKPVLAAAGGTATYMSSCTACGNAILIDHGNGYQTRYYHMQKDGLIVSVPGESMEVTRGQEIGKVGFSGNVIPSEEAGSHLHFMVIQDKDGNGDFSDNIPDGMTDPFGWQSTESDPWENYMFEQGDEQKTGNKSYYLFTKKLDNLNESLSSNAKVFTVGKTTLDFPAGATDQNLNLTVKSAPNFANLSGLNSLGSIILVEAKNQAGQLITNFAKNFGLTINFSQFDLNRFKLDTLSIYSSPDGINWIKEPTQIDLSNQTATTSINHLTYFALMGERRDSLAPLTTAILEGEKGTGNNFRSDVKLSLNAIDNEGGLGVEFSAYSIGETEWQTYNSPLNFSTEGTHRVYFYSQDNDGNIEDIKSVEFSIDKTVPEAKVFIDLSKMDLAVEGIDQNPTTTSRQENLETSKKDDAIYTVSDIAGNTLTLDVRDRDRDKKDQFRIHSLKYNQDAPIILEQNQFNVTYNGKKDRLNVKEQNFEVKNKTKVKIQYDLKKNQSTTIAEESGSEKVKEIKNGLTLLWLKTDKGKLDYGY